MPDDYDPDTYPSQWNYLLPGTVLDQYMIERDLAHGGFSSVYLARQLSDQQQVAIKEYLPRRLAHRTWNNIIVPHSEETRSLFLHGRTLFIEEAKVLANLKHPNIVKVINFFQANATVYMVMTYDYGKILSKYLREVKRRLSECFMLTVFPGLLDGIKTIHAHNLLHLDIKPANILIRPGGDPLLLDFGAAQPYPKTKTWKPGKVRTQGYSPIEQYSAEGNIGPWSDIYATGATMRTCLDCRPPPDAKERRNHDTLVPAAKAYKGKYAKKLLEAIDWAMEIEPDKRPQSVDEFLKAFPPPSASGSGVFDVLGKKRNFFSALSGRSERDTPSTQ
ncbi:MAG: serine/threonine-protein kinase [Pseudomonadota bacterium]